MTQSSKIKIAVNGRFLENPKVGMGQYTYKVLSELNKKNVDLSVVISFPKKDPKFLELEKIFGDSVQWVYARIPFYRRQDLIEKFLWEKVLFPEAVNRMAPDIVWSPYLSVSIVNFPHIMTVHDLVHREFPQYVCNARWKTYFGMADQALRKVDGLLTISKFSEQELKRFYPNFNKPVVVSPLACTLTLDEIQNADANKAITQYGEYILYVGGFDMRKNVDTLIKAYKKFLDQSSSKQIVKLVLPGNLIQSKIVPDLQSLVNDLGLSQKVIFPGFVGREELLDMYAGAKLFVYPSKYEGFGLPLLEAMSFGVPVIGAKWGSIKEVCGQAGYLVDVCDESQLAEAIAKTLYDQPLRETLAKKGLERVKNFDWDQTAEMTYQAFLDILKV